MKATGVVRRVDDLGRIVIPKEIRRILKAWAHSFGNVPGFSLFAHLSATAFVDTMRADKTEGGKVNASNI